MHQPCKTSPLSEVQKSTSYGQLVISQTINGTETMIHSLITKEQIKDLGDSSALVGGEIHSFEQALSIVSPKERKSLILGHKMILNKLADEGTLDQLIFYVHAYKEKQGLSKILPPIEDVIDISHTQIFLAMIFEPSKRSPKAQHINDIVKMVVENTNIVDALSCARELKGREFEKYFAMDMVRSVLKDRAHGEDFPVDSRYNSLSIDRDSFDVYHMFKKQEVPCVLGKDEGDVVEIFASTVAQEQEFEQEIAEAEYLDMFDPLIQVLGEIEDYDRELFQDIVACIKVTYIKRGNSASIPTLTLNTFRNFREVVLENKQSIPDKVKAAYKSQDYVDISDHSLPQLTFEGDTGWREDEDDDDGEKEDFYIQDFGDELDDRAKF